MAHQMNNKSDFWAQRTHNNNNNSKMRLQLIQFLGTLIVLKSIVANAAHIAMDATDKTTTTTTTTAATLQSMHNQMQATVVEWQKEETPLKNVPTRVEMLTAKSNLHVSNDDDVAHAVANNEADEIAFDTKLNLHAKVHSSATTSQTQLPSITMDSLEQLRAIRAIAASAAARPTAGVATIAAAARSEATTHKRAKSMTATKHGSSIALVKYKRNNGVSTNNKWHSNYNNNNNNNDNNYGGQPIYELQLVAWPADIEYDIEDAWTRPTERPTKRPTQRPTTTKTTTTTTTKRPLMPLYEHEFDEESLDYFFDDVTVATTSMHKPHLNIPKPPPTRPSVEVSTAPTIYVVHDYHIMHPNGTAEYRLELSNGLVNYKKIYNKFVDDYVVVVQEGYDSVPMPGREHEFQTQYYIADEHGYNVYKLEYTHIRPELPEFLSYDGSEM